MLLLWHKSSETSVYEMFRNTFSAVHGFLIAALSTSCLLTVATAEAAQPPRFNYQAKLSDSSGAPLQGLHTLTVRIYQGGDATTANSGKKVYEETVTPNIANGIVSHAVGTGTGQTLGPLEASTLRTSGDVFLQVAVDGAGNVVIPRTRLESVPYSILSADGDARIPISQPSSFPLIINEPGSYYLTENVISPNSGIDGIQITTSGVV